MIGTLRTFDIDAGMVERAARRAVAEGIGNVLVEQRDVFYYVTLMNENYAQPGLKKGQEEGILKGMYRLPCLDPADSQECKEYTIAAFAQVAMGALIDRFEMKRLMVGVALVQIPLLALAANLEGWAMLAAALAMMLAIFGQIPLNDAIVGRYVADESRARVLGVRYVVSLGVAAVAKAK